MTHVRLQICNKLYIIIDSNINILNITCEPSQLKEPFLEEYLPELNKYYGEMDEFN